MPFRHTHTHKGGGQGETLFLHDQEPRDMVHGRAKVKARERTTTIDEVSEQWYFGPRHGHDWLFGVAVLISVSFLLFVVWRCTVKKVKGKTVPETKPKTSSAWTLTMSLCFRPLPAHPMVPEETKAKGHWGE